MDIPRVIPTVNSIEFNVKPPSDTGGLELLEYIVKYEQIDIPNSVKMISFPGRSDRLRKCS